ncbi:MAG: hypothetical protein IT553_02620 [Sphingomonadaceae bacterium]|nr:hypothetical protein [Sphingomonadaceae bacterium]
MPKPPIITRSAEALARRAGGAIGGGAGKAARKAADNPIANAAIGFAATWVAGKLLPRRFAGIGAALVVGYATRKLAQRHENTTARDAPPAAPTPPRRQRKS